MKSFGTRGQQRSPARPEAGEGHIPFEKPLGFANGIRKQGELEPNKINGLQVETVGFQTLSLRHFTSANSPTAPMSAEIPFGFKGV